jgi:hypothetical protein
VLRFEKNDIVMIRDVIWTRRKGQAGIVIEVRPSKAGRASSLDKSLVRFADAEEEEFWDVQLERAQKDQAECGSKN